MPGLIMAILYPFYTQAFNPHIQSTFLILFSITRTGERTIFGSIHHKYKSLMRFVAQFSDHKKQNGIN